MTAVASRDAARRERFLALVPGATAHAEPHAILDEADLLFLTVPDDEIVAVAAGIRLYSGQAIVHTSGVLPAAALAPAMAAGTEAGSFHPLVAFTDLDTALGALPGSRIAIEGDEGLLPLLEEIAGALGARPVRVTAEGKVAHHAAAVLAAGGLVALLDVIAELGAAAGLRGEDRWERMPALPSRVSRTPVGSARAFAYRAHRARRRGNRATPPRGPAAGAPDALPVYVALTERALLIAEARGELEQARSAELLALLASAR